ncbi:MULTISPECIES: DUF305 domain-containing protein [unclassified Streptomyces]|uniref:DUF305 domain-containing protein n=1 Tax=unclassified Streptomyces TaxID=2593676 RepID=UPI0023669AE3|nr:MULTISPECIES: DUF305 domain-containing protein [unclassified Streptomyces]MDF3142518.1 DUF305 domain-containing protein [Streptomyces sp. T21Q-yed]WDF39780.1 DUF305 domain-containing protein [Streptomyces sp. T12]
MTNTRTLTRRAALATTAVTAALVLAACGGTDHSDTASGGHTSPSASAGATADAAAGAHNDQDVSFAQGMIPHHQQAVQMADMAAGRASSAAVKDLASRIQKAQDPEIRTMSGWLKAWGEDVPSAMPGMDHSGGHSGGSGGSGDMAGMMDQKDMDELMKASGKAFDTLFLTMMVEHHEGAVEMATAEKTKGQYGPATKLAGDVVTAQTAEIAEMSKLLGKSGS